MQYEYDSIWIPYGNLTKLRKIANLYMIDLFTENGHCYRWPEASTPKSIDWSSFDISEALMLVKQQ